MEPNIFFTLTDNTPSTIPVSGGLVASFVGSTDGRTVNVNATDGSAAVGLSAGTELNLQGLNAADASITLDGTTVIISDASGTEVARIAAASTTDSTVRFADGGADITVDGTTVDVGGTDLPADGSAVDGDSIAVSGDGAPPLPGDVGVPTVSVSSPATVSEGSTASFTVTLSEASTEDTTVDYAISLDGGATSADHGTPQLDGSDAGLTGTVTIPAGSLTQALTIPFASDNETPEEGEAVSVTLSNPSDGVELGTASTTSAIGDVFPFSLSQGIEEVEEGDQVTYTLAAASPVVEDTVVAFSVVPGDAGADNQGTNETNLNDFDQGSFNPSKVTISKGETEAEFTLTTQTDSITELPEDFTLQAEVNGQTVTIETTLLDGSGFTLTNNNDAFSGDANDDVFTSGLGTLDNGDILEGLGGNDVLNARLSGVTRNPTMDSVDTVNIDARASTAEIDLQNASGTTSGSVTGSSDAKISAAGTDFTTFTVKGNNQDGAYDSTATLEYVDDAFTGSEDEVTIIAEMLSGATINLGQAASTGTNNLEVLNIQSNGSAANTFSFNNSGTVALDAINKTVLTGDADATITTQNANFDLNAAKIDATGHDGVLDIITDDTTAIDASNINGLDELTLTGTYNAAITSLEEGADVEATAATTLIDIQQRGADIAGSLNDTVNVTLNPGADATQTKIRIDDVETVSLTSTSSATDPTTVTNTITDFEGDALGTLNVSGPSDVTFTNALSDQVDVINASGLTGAISANVLTNNTAAVAFTGGAGGDTFTASTFADALVGGEGGDSLTGDQGADIYTLGAGGDDVIIGAADESGVADNARDLITDFTLNEDDLDISAGGGTNQHNAVSVETDAMGNVAAATIELIRGNFSDSTDPTASAFTVATDGSDVLVRFEFAGANAAADVEVGLLGLGANIGDIDIDDFVV